MDASFRAAATFFKRAPQQLGHHARVVRLYRHCLKAVVSWAVDRDLVNSEASRIRGLFEKNRTATPDVAARLIREADEKLFELTHPDKYVVPYMPGGSKFMRNAPPPLEAAFPNGIPEDIKQNEQPVHPDQVPYRFRPENDTVLVDAMAKAMY